MAIIAREQKQSQHLEGGRNINRGRRLFIVYDEAEAVIDGISASAAVGLPVVYTGGAGTGATTFPGISNLFCTRLLFDHEKGSNKYQATVLYEGVPPNAKFEFQPIEQLVLQDIYRAQPYTIPPTNPNPTGIDIGGVPIDWNGVPGKEPAESAVARFSKPVIALSSADLPYVSWAETLGSVNESTFQGAPPRTMKYIGSTLNRVGELVSLLTHEFRYDKKRHLVQRAGLDQNTEVVIVPDFSPIPIPLRFVAGNVQWFHIGDIPLEVDFGAFFGIPAPPP